uniref:Chondroitin proteoglycan 4 domain-containing protein n=1 Tax=Wuchereria bancrofti TaxID=6293 RepID=A0AAF5Q145_WUCBA
MKIWCLLLLVSAIIVPLSAQIPLQPIATTNSECLNDCLKQGSLIFAADNLRNFRKIVLHIEEFCNTRDKLLKCIQSCTNDEQEGLRKNTSLSGYMCEDKLEEFRLVKECMGNQGDIDSVNKCSNECGHPSDATIQLDSSSFAPVNPFAFTDGIAQICRTIKCTIKCSIMESNKICAGSGYLFRDIGFKQVLEASEQLQNDVLNSSSSTQQLTKTYLESLPQQCTYIINPTNYNMTFEENETNDEFKTLISETMENEKNTDEERMKDITPEMLNTNNDAIITRIIDEQFTTKTTEVSNDDGTTKEKMEKEETMIAGTENEFDNVMESTTLDNVAFTTENVDNTSLKSETASVQSHEIMEQEEEDDDHDDDDDDKLSVKTISIDEQSRNMEEDETTVANHEEENKSVKWSSAMDESDERESNNLQHQSISTIAQEITERTIVVVNDDDNEIHTNIILQAEQKEPTKHGVRERITLSLLLILPSMSLYLFSQ